MSGVNPGFVAALRGPIMMITIGVLFLLDKFTPFQFGRTWPVILIILGALALAGGRRDLPSAPGSEEPLYPRMAANPPQPPPPGVRR